jgi:hypothetical protein
MYVDSLYNAKVDLDKDNTNMVTAIKSLKKEAKDIHFKHEHIFFFK